jgi:ADP-heptose:LPS heptosyltransferase
MHNYDRQAEQLEIAGIAHVPPPDISFLKSDLRNFNLPAEYLLLVPGGSAHRPEKRWPAVGYTAIAHAALDRGITPVLIGSTDERNLLSGIAAEVPGTRNLGGETGFADLAELARGARAAVGNDTGPMHLIAVAGCPSVVLFSGASSPKKCAPRGRHVITLQRPELSDLDPRTVARAAGL